MSNPEHEKILRQGVEPWNKWRIQNREIIPDLIGLNYFEAGLCDVDLSGADFSEARLSNADLKMACLNRANLREALLNNADLSGGRLNSANLSKANLIMADLREALLNNADLSGARLNYANLEGAHLNRANLSGARLSSANLSGARLSSANLSGARLRQTVLGFLDLRGVKGLESVVHGGPSSIGIETVYQSNGEIPEVFLRGAGVPGDFINFAKSLVGTALDFYSCFISYSTTDQDFADRLHADLQNKSVRSWFAPHDIQGGKKTHEQIDEAIRVYDRLLLILSDASMNSEWVKTEIAHARQKEVNQKCPVLFPISLVDYSKIEDWKCFDADTGKDSAREIREYFIPDFSNWKNHDSYQKAFERLLKDLKTENTKALAQ